MSSHQPSSRQTARNVVSIWANRVLAAAAPLVTTPLIANEFGLAVTGVWLLVTQLASQLALLDAGLANSLVRLLARERSKGSEGRVAQVLSTALVCLAGIGALMLLAAPWIAAAFAAAYALPADNQTASHRLTLLAVAFVALSLPLRAGHGMLASRHRFDIVQAWEGAAIAFRLVVIVLLFKLGDPDVFDLGLVVFGSTLACLLAIFVQGLAINGGRAVVNPRQFAPPALREMVAMSLAAMLVTLAAVLMNQVSGSLVGYTLGTASVALIAFPLLIFTSITPFFSTFAAIASPIAAGVRTDAEKERYLSVYTLITRYLCAASCLVALLCWWWGDAVLHAWLGGPKVSAAEVAQMALALDVILLGFALSATSAIGRSILGAVGSHWAVAIAEVSTSALGVLLGLVLIHFTALGTLGMAIGIAVALAARGLVWYPLLVGSYFRTRPLGLLVGCIAAPLAVAAAALALSAALHQSLRTALASQALLALAAGGLALLVWLLGTWRHVLATEHRAALRHRLGWPA